MSTRLLGYVLRKNAAQAPSVDGYDSRGIERISAKPVADLLPSQIGTTALGQVLEIVRQ